MIPMLTLSQRRDNREVDTPPLEFQHATGHPRPHDGFRFETIRTTYAVGTKANAAYEGLPDFLTARATRDAHFGESAGP
jgi:hypothetical protein